MDVLRTPAERFADLPDYPFAPHELAVDSGLSMHYLDEGPRNANPLGDGPPARAFALWRGFARWSPLFPIGRIVGSGCVTKLTPAIRAAYDAPFPSDRYKVGARVFPMLVPTEPDDPAVPANRAAWDVLSRWHKLIPW